MSVGHVCLLVPRVLATLKIYIVSGSSVKRLLKLFFEEVLVALLSDGESRLR